MTGAAAPAVSPRRKAAPASPLTVPPRPRRVSGPARKAAEDRGAAGRPDQYRGIAPALIAASERLSHHRWLGGRAWIAFVAFALIGIVTMQLGLLKLNAGIGRALEHEALLQRENAALSIENSELSGSGHVLSLAARLGMAPVPAGGVHFLQARPGIDVRLGAAALSAPAHVPTTTSAESSPEGSQGIQAASGEQSTTQAGTAAPSGESSSGASAASAASPEASAGESAGTQPSAESTGPTAGQPAAPSAESTGAPTGALPSTPAGAGSSAGAGTPAGGTQAGSSG
jgi:hypothetical protein